MNDRNLKIGTTRLVDIHVWYSYVLGMWPRKDSTMMYIVYGYIYQTITTFGWTLAKCIETAFTPGKSEFIFLTSTSTYCVVGSMRTVVILRRSKAINICLDAISELFVNQAEYEILQPKIRAFSYLSGGYISFICIALTTTLINPIISVERALPVPVWLPLDWKENDRDFAIALAFSTGGVFAMVNASGLSSVLLWYLLYGCSLTVDILGHRLKGLGYKQNGQKETLKELVECIKLHQEIVKNVSRIEHIFSGVLFFQISSSALCICAIVYVLATEPIGVNINSSTTHISMGTVYLCEIGALIYVGNEIALQTDKLSYCMFESNWTPMSAKYRKLMVFVVEQWKKPRLLLIGKVFLLRMNLLTSILNMTYSILNLLRKDQSLGGDDMARRRFN